MSPEGPPGSPQETSVEHIPTREEILFELGKYIENSKVTKELKDEKGVYFLRVQASGKNPGEIIEYTYLREGDFGSMAPQRTSICVAYLEGGEVVWGEDKAHYDAKTKKWE